MPRRKNHEQGDEPSFEQALAELEAIVEAMEHENLPLEELVAHYEKGSALLARCDAVLQGARGRIELITLRSQGEIPLEGAANPTEGSAPSPPPAPPPPGAPDDDDDDDDIRLF